MRIAFMSLAVLAFCGLLRTSVCAAAGAATQVTIVRPDSDAWLAQYATDELSRYVKQMTGAVVHQIDTTEAGVSHNGLVITLALGDAAKRLNDLPGHDDPARAHDGFVIRSDDRG